MKPFKTYKTEKEILERYSYASIVKYNENGKATLRAHTSYSSALSASKGAILRRNGKVFASIG